MAGPKGSKYYDIFLKHQVELVCGGKTIIDEEAFRLFEAVESGNSIVEAARILDISYRKAWGIIREVEKDLGFSLFAKQRGGRAGGRTTFTPEGAELIKAYRKLLAGLESSDREIIRTFFRSLNHINGEK